MQRSNFATLDAGDWPGHKDIEMLKRPVSFKVGRFYDVEIVDGGVTQTRFNLEAVAVANTEVMFKNRAGATFTIGTSRKVLVAARPNILSEPAKVLKCADNHAAAKEEPAAPQVAIAANSPPLTPVLVHTAG